MTISTNPNRREVQDLISRGKLKFTDIVPPIDEEIIDGPLLFKTFEKLPLIPYSGIDGQTSHQTVNLLYRFKVMSTTFSGILSDFKHYALKGKIDVVTHSNSFFDIGDDKEVDLSAKKEYSDLVSENFLFEDRTPKDLACLVSDSWHSVGQWGILVTTRKVLDKFVIVVKYIPPTMYCFTRDPRLGNGNEVALSRHWDYEYLKKNPPMLVGVHPYEYNYANGDVSTFFFQKNGGELYGRPDDLSAMHAKYNEFKMEQYLTKKNKKMWMPDVFIEFEDAEDVNPIISDEEAQDAGYEDAVDRFERNFTNLGDDPRSAIITNRPKGSSPTFIHEFGGLKDASEYTAFLSMFKLKILEANGWPLKLFNMDGNTGLSTNTFLDIFSIKAVTKIEEIQCVAAGAVNRVLIYGLNKLGIKSELGIKFSAPLKDLLNDYNQSKRSSSKLPITEGDQQQPPANM